MAERKIKRALIAVYDKTGIAEFARALVDEFGIEIISTGGTAKHLKDAGIPVTMVEEVTGFPEMLDGRVKTLHPKIHAAILADRDNPEHMRQLAEHGIKPIDMVVVNLYPFEKTVSDPNCTLEQAIEMIDIGGPCMLRAAAKNHKHVLVLSNREMYNIESKTWYLPNFRLDMARHAICTTSSYDASIAAYLSGSIQDKHFTGVKTVRLIAPHRLRHGENPHANGAAYEHAHFYEGDFLSEARRSDLSLVRSSPLGGGAEMSFNNHVDADAALALCSELTRAKGKVWHRLIAGASQGQAGKLVAPITDQLETRRNLPHIQRPGATYFVTFRLKTGILSPDERDMVMECCLFPDGKKACIHAVTVMPDHVHLIFTPLDTPDGNAIQLGDVLHGVKGVSARKVSDSRGRGSGPIWQDESFDRILRGKTEFHEILHYMWANPTTAGMATDGDYAWCVCEREPGWDSYNDRGGVDLGHEFVCSGSESEGRAWHRLLAGATPFGISTCCFIKHTNACGVGVADDPMEAYQRAYLGDVNAAMGGILAVNFKVTSEFATMVMETYDRMGKAAGAGGFFVEVWVAPSFDEEAQEIIRGRKSGGPVKKWGENVRLLAVGDMSVSPDSDQLEYKSIAGGMLVQSRDLLGLNEDQWKVVTKRTPTESEKADLRLAWLIAKHTKSNAISICKDGMLIGNGAGQMSRVMSCRIATWLAKENGHADKLAGSAAASDAFFPFRDGPDILMHAGVTAIIQPGGSKRDEDTIKACDERGTAMIFTGTRHFKH